MHTQTEKKWFTTLGLFLCLAMIIFCVVALLPTAAGAYEVECTTVGDLQYCTVKLHPNSNIPGFVSWYPVPYNPAHYELVNDASDDTFVYTYTSGGFNKELFFVESYGLPEGATINWVRVAGRGMWGGRYSPGFQPLFTPDCPAGNFFWLASSWAPWASDSVTTCPWTGSAWTQQDIDDVRAGFMNPGAGGNNGVLKVSEVWVEINYTY